MEWFTSLAMALAHMHRFAPAAPSEATERARARRSTASLRLCKAGCSVSGLGAVGGLDWTALDWTDSSAKPVERFRAI